MMYTKQINQIYISIYFSFPHVIMVPLALPAGSTITFSHVERNLSLRAKVLEIIATFSPLKEKKRENTLIDVEAE